MRAAEIVIATTGDPVTVRATVIGHLAVHRGLSGGWMVSHLATGCRLRQFASKKKALAVAGILERECADDLGAMAQMRFATKASPATRGKWKASGARLKAALEKAARS